MVNWKSIIEEYGPLVWSIAHRLLGNEADASDCFQEVFVTAVQTSRKQKIRNMEAFLGMVATQRGIDLLRKRRPNFRLHRLNADGQSLESTEPAPLIRAQSQELTEQLRTAMSRIPQQEAEVFCLRILNEFSYRQIAEEMKLNENHVGVLINRARKKLQELLRTVAVEYRREAAHE